MTAAERITAEREEQGLDATVTDAAALARIAAIVAKGDTDASTQ